MAGTTETTMLRRMTADFGVRYSTPVQLGTGGTLPAAGATLTRTYAAALPAGAVASFAYFNERISGWQVVPSTLSPDRRNLNRPGESGDFLA